jgi:hypothetical protein
MDIFRDRFRQKVEDDGIPSCCPGAGQESNQAPPRLNRFLDLPHPPTPHATPCGAISSINRIAVDTKWLVASAKKRFVR